MTPDELRERLERFGGGALGVGARAPVVDRHVGAGRGEAERDRPTDADATSGYESGFPGEREAHSARDRNLWAPCVVSCEESIVCPFGLQE